MQVSSSEDEGGEGSETQTQQVIQLSDFNDENDKQIFLKNILGESRLK